MSHRSDFSLLDILTFTADGCNGSSGGGGGGVVDNGSTALAVNLVGLVAALFTGIVFAKV